MRLVTALVVVLWLGAAAAAVPVAISLERARSMMPGDTGCATVECLIEQAYPADPHAGQLALALWTESGDLAGVGEDEIMDGTYRGRIHLVPQLPVRRYRVHLDRVLAATRWLDRFFAGAFAGQPAPSYRWHSLAFRFVRSVDRHTPSAYAGSWAITYNVEGSLLGSEDGVRDTVLHELFHLNDEAHADWSAQHLAADYAAILTRCEKVANRSRCLEPYAPNDTKVRNGTYYAFTQNNGNAVHEYAAELAVRYFKEQSEMLASRKLGRPAFKCARPENARAWQALVDEFFAGRDLVPGC